LYKCQGLKGYVHPAPPNRSQSVHHPENFCSNHSNHCHLSALVACLGRKGRIVENVDLHILNCTIMENDTSIITCLQQAITRKRTAPTSIVIHPLELL
jgi:hypothetical protein